MSNSNSKVAIVTDAARGIGLAIAEWFLAHEHRVALLDIDGESLDRAARQLGDAARVQALHCDVSVPAQVLAAVAAVDGRFGRVDALVNNAGVAIFKPLLQTSFDEWRHVMSTNLDGPFLCTQAAAPLMLRGSGGRSACPACALRRRRDPSRREQRQTSCKRVLRVGVARCGRVAGRHQ